MEVAVRNRLAEQIEKIVGPKYVRADDVTRWSYAVEDFGGIFFYPFSDKYGPPDLVVKPHSAKEISEIVKLANLHKVPIIARGGGEDMTGSCTPLKDKGGIILDTTDMTKVLDIQEGMNAVRFQPGIRWGELHHELEKHGITVGVRGPHGFLGGTLGGGIGGNCFSINSPKYGWVTENVLTLQVVLPNGDIIETGSLSNTKVKDWYFRACLGPDLVGIFLGGAGAFGVITEVSMRTYPMPKFSDTLAYTFPDPSSELKFVHQVQWYGYVTELWGIAYFALHESMKRIIRPLIGERDLVLLTTEAHDKGIFKAQKKAIDRMAKEYGGKVLPIQGAMRALNMTVVDTSEWAAGGLYGKVMGPNDICSCSIAPLLRWEKVVQSQLEVMKKYEDCLTGSLPMIGAEHFYIFPQLLGGGQVCQSVCSTPIDMIDKPQNVEKARELYSATMNNYLESGSVAVYRLGKEGHYALTRMKPEYLDFMKTIKRALDPNNIMNPGALGLGLEEAR